MLKKSTYNKSFLIYNNRAEKGKNRQTKKCS